MRTKAGFFSITAVTPPEQAGEEREYLRWHLLDHMPEQYQLPGIVHGIRWTADEQHRRARMIAHPPLDRLGNVVHYLFADPVEETLGEFVDLGSSLRKAGRFPLVRPSLRLAALQLQTAVSAPRARVSAGVVPFRPHRGVLLLIERPVNDQAGRWSDWLEAEHYPKVLDQSGVAGAWMFGAPYPPPRASAAWSSEPHFVTVIYLDQDPVETTIRLKPLIEERWASEEVVPLFAGPLRSMIEWEAWR